MNFKETVLLLVFGSASAAYLLFNDTAILGPYGTPGDVYHEIILGGLLFMGGLFIFIASKVDKEE